VLLKNRQEDKMSRAFTLIAVLPLAILTTTAPVRADQLDSLAGRYAFDWRTEPAKTKCKVVDQKLLETFKSPAYACDLKEKHNSATGQPCVTCTGKSKEFLIFKTKALCEGEREAQAANE
jgi:hypothetical protein